MKISTNYIFKSLLSIFFITSIFNAVLKNNYSITGLFLSTNFPFVSIFSILKELSMFLLIFPPVINNLLKNSFKYNKNFLICLAFFCFTLIGSPIYTNKFSVIYSLFFLRCFWPILLAFIYQNSKLINQNKKLILRLVLIFILVNFYFLVENILIGSCQANRCPSFYLSPNSLGFSAISCILIIYKLCGSELFSRNYIFYFIPLSIFVGVSLSVSSIITLAIFCLPFIFLKNPRLFSLKLNKVFFIAQIIFFPLFIYFLNLFFQKGLLNLEGAWVQTSFLKRFEALAISIFSSDGTINILGQPGVFTNIGRIYDSEIGVITDSTLTTIIGNFGVIIIPLLILLSIKLIYNYSMVFKNPKSLNRINLGNNNLIIFCLSIVGIGINIFEVAPMAIILGLVILSYNPYTDKLII